MLTEPLNPSKLNRGRAFWICS